MKKIKINSNVIISGGLILLGVAQAILSNKKSKNELNDLKKEVTEDVMALLSKND